MQLMEKKGWSVYRRYMDDFFIFASTRWKLKQAIREMHRILTHLKLKVHRIKRFIGHTKKGFDFLGYRIQPNRKLKPSLESLRRLKECARRLYEQGASMERLRCYVTRWYQWLHGGLGGVVSESYSVTRYFAYALIQSRNTGRS